MYKVPFSLLLCLLAFSVAAAVSNTDGATREYRMVGARSFFVGSQLPGRFFSHVGQCVKKDTPQAPCALVHKADEEDVILLDLCIPTGGFDRGLYQVSASTGEATRIEWFDERFMAWACVEATGPDDLIYTGVRNGIRGPWDVLIINYSINQLAGYYLIKLDGTRAIVLDQKRSDLT